MTVLMYASAVNLVMGLCHARAWPQVVQDKDGRDSIHSSVLVRHGYDTNQRGDLRAEEREAHMNDEKATEWLNAMKAKGHKPFLDEDGELDRWVTSVGIHNGPGCEKCGWTRCWHCISIQDIPKCPIP